MALSATAKAMPIIFTTSEEFDIWLSGDGEEALNRHSPDGWSIQPPGMEGYLSQQTRRQHRAELGGLLLVSSICHLAFPAENPGRLIVSAWFSGIAIFGAICLYKGWAYEALFPF
jgi:hypothetical protein